MIPLPPGPFSVIYADPPWKYADRRNKHTRFCGGAESHYSTMPLDAICALPVRDILAPNAMLFLWCTWPTMCSDGAHERVAKAWGFTLKTCGFMWVKTNRVSGTPFFGIGYYMASNSEPCLLGVRGKPWKTSRKPSQIVLSPRREHSRKPDEVRDRIVQFCGDVPRLEMFARASAPGWESWGNQLDAADYRPRRDVPDHSPTLFEDATPA